MSRNKSWFRATALAGLAALGWIALAPTVQSQSQPDTAPQYTPDGQLKLPVGFETWVFVGSNLGLAYKEELPANTALEAALLNKQEFHNIYINPEAYAYFLANKEFPDKTVLVMDVFTAPDREPRDVLAAGVYNGKQIGLRVAVKNLHRPDGKTTPWAYYTLMDPFDPRRCWRRRRKRMRIPSATIATRRMPARTTSGFSFIRRCASCLIRA